MAGRGVRASLADIVHPTLRCREGWGTRRLSGCAGLEFSCEGVELFTSKAVAREAGGVLESVRRLR